MNRITLSFIFFILILQFFPDVVTGQNHKLIDLNNPPGSTPTIDYYVLDVFDSRNLKSSIGITKSANKNDIVMLNFKTGFHDELDSYYTNNYPAGEGKAPIILNIRKLWINESSEEESNYYRSEVTIEFLTPKNQKFHECSVKNEIEFGDNPNIFKDIVILSLNDCMQKLEGEEIKQTYYAILSSNAASVKSNEGGLSPDASMEGSEIKEVSSVSKSRISLNGGYSYRLARIPDDVGQEVEQYFKDLKNGFHLGSDLQYFFNEKNGFGASFSFSQAKSSLSDVIMTDLAGNIVAQGDVEDNVKLYYICPSYISRAISNDSKRFFMYSLSVGYYAYTNDAVLFDEPFNITGGTVGFGLSFGVDFLTSDILAVGLQASLIAGWMNKMKVDGVEVDLDESENLSRIDISIGIRILP